jgi:predicted transcriptional regulator
MKKIKEIMATDLKTVGKNESLKTVATQMAKANVGSLPVVDENQQVIGMITDRDMSMAFSKIDRTAKEIKVQEVMTKNVFTCKEEDDPITALGIMRTKKVGRLPVVDKENKLTGIITLDSILRKAQHTSDEEQILFRGKENVLNTLNSIAERNELEVH